MALGPWFFAEPEAIIPSLPFPSVVDWRSIAIFAGPLSCIAEVNFTVPNVWGRGRVTGDQEVRTITEK